ncbi:MAG: DEAD/DEAH box helicase [Micrococcales bacterium]|nr:DEAD/DEAH box helicase [Micrococcales bacterium]
MPKKSIPGAKKPRWSAAQKAAHKSVKAGKKPHRGQSAAAESRPRKRAYAADERPQERRPARGQRFERSDRPQRSDRGYDRPQRGERFERSDRPQRSDRGYDRPQHGERFERSDRPQRSDRGYDRPQRSDRFERPDRPQRSDRGYDRPQRSDRFERSDRPQRSDRGYDRPQRSDRFERSDRPQRSDRGYDRPQRSDRFERSDRPQRSERFERPERPGRHHHSAETRSPRGDFEPRRERRPLRREGRDDRRFDRGERGERGERGFDRGYDRRPDRGDRFARPDAAELAAQAEAERHEADTWTKATRREVDGPVEVTSDNGFAALGVPEELVLKLAKSGITEPFPIQTATIPDALAGKDVLGRGQTGSGKTLAFGLPTLTRIAASGKAAPRRPRALVLVPTRELAMQVSDALEPLAHVLGLRQRLVAGGLSYEGQIKALDRGIELLIATPGRLGDLLERGAVELDDIEVAILDEADHMADMGFLPEVTAILDRAPEGGQRLLFSATLDKGIDGLVERYLVDPVVHSTDDAQASVDTMEHHVILVEPTHKKVITAEVANREGRTVVFVRTKLGADRVAEQLREAGVFAAALHGGLTQSARNRVLGAFREGTLPVLVATDVAARGIHVDDVSVVLQVDPPADFKDYLHRSGRTARAGERGTVVTLALPHQRRTMERMVRDAGVDTKPVKAVPGDEVLAAAGARPVSGVAIEPERLRAVLEPPRKGRPGRGPRGGGPRGGGFRGRDDRPRGGRGERSERPRRDRDGDGRPDWRPRERGERSGGRRY